MTKRANRLAKKNNTSNSTLELRKINPLTPNQDLTFQNYRNGYNLVLHGTAGTGKTFISMYLALQEILSGKSPYKRLVIIRSVVQGRDMGHLPGSMKEKIAVYEEPYREICSNLFNRGDAYELLKSYGIIQFASTSFMRGTTLNDSIIIIDEIQNCNFSHEIWTLMTRPGDVSRMIICGDFRQTDLNGKYEKEGVTQLMKITSRMKSFRNVEFEIADIVRGTIPREFIIACEQLGL